jgi:hypothetical protein
MPSRRVRTRSDRCARPGADSAQAAAPAPAVSLERIRQALESPPATVTVESTNPNLPPIFRLEIRDRALAYEHLWEQNWVPSYVRPSRGLYHHEFLEQVTPDLFRATSMYPCCPVLPIVNFIRGKLGKTGPEKESNARSEVKQALAEFLAQQSKNQQPKKEDKP